MKRFIVGVAAVGVITLLASCGGSAALSDTAVASSSTSGGVSATTALATPDILHQTAYSSMLTQDLTLSHLYTQGELLGFGMEACAHGAATGDESGAVSWLMAHHHFNILLPETTDAQIELAQSIVSAARYLC